MVRFFRYGSVSLLLMVSGIIFGMGSVVCLAGKENALTKQKKREEIKQLVDQLGSKFLRKRRRARKKLIQKGKDVIPFLKETLPEADYRVRMNILRVFGGVSDQRVLPTLFQYLESSNPSEQMTAQKAILNYGVEALHELKTYMAKHPQKKAILQEQYIELVRKKVEKVLLDEITPKGGIGFYDGQFSDLEPLGEKAVKVLRNIALGEYDFVTELPRHVRKDKRLRGQLEVMALRAIGACGTEDSITFLEKFYGVISSAQEVDSRSQAAAYAMYRLGDQKPLKKILKILENESKNINDMDVGIGQLQLGEIRKRQILFKLASVYSLVSKDKEALKTYRTILDVFGKEDNGVVFYNIACTYARMGKVQKGVNALEKAVSHGYKDYFWMETDGDLEPLRKTDRYRKLIERLKGEE